MNASGPVVHALYLFSACWILAQIEIQIEAKHGWAEKLPTWRLSSPWLLKITNGKPVTGYHFYLNCFLLLIMHFPLIFNEFSRPLEAKILSSFFFMTIVWDFQWFVWNPFWGARRFLTEHIWWFPKKILGFPLEYYTGAGSSLAATLILWNQGLGEWTALAATLAALSLLSIVAAQWTNWRPKLTVGGQSHDY
ncbi:MAG: hypothetical protein AAB091_01175 [Elusimicrobiota bacterium]